MIEREVRIDAEPATVFEFFTDPEKAVRWMGSKATFDPRPGGVYRLEMSERFITSGEFVEVDPPNRVVFTWGWEGEDNFTPPGSSTVEVTLTADGEGTLVRVLHRDLPAPAVNAHAQGWDLYLPRLAIVAVGGDPGPRPQMDV